jgi:hypothetical protein
MKEPDGQEWSRGGWRRKRRKGEWGGEHGGYDDNNDTILFPVSLINLKYTRFAANSKVHFYIEKLQEIEKER